eukprot:scaffold125_cov240-Pinguiococcus_pyrenoidosus.AAC.2
MDLNALVDRLAPAYGVGELSFPFSSPLLSSALIKPTFFLPKRRDFTTSSAIDRQIRRQSAQKGGDCDASGGQIDASAAQRGI